MPPSFLIVFPIHGIESSYVGVCHGVSACLARLTFIGVVQGPHTRSIIMVQAPIIFLALKSLDESIIFLAVCLFGRFVLPCPFVIGFLLLFLRFLGWGFLGGLFLAHWFLLVLLGGSASMFLLQRVYLCCHGHNLLLFFCGLTPRIFFIQQSCFILVFHTYHQVFCCEGHPSVIALTLEVLDVHHKFIVRGSFVSLPEIVE